MRKILSNLLTANVDATGRECIVLPLDVFEISGPNGIHNYIVSQVTGSNIYSAPEESEHGVISLAMAARATLDVSQGVAYLHSCGIGHGGKSISGPRLIICPADSYFTGFAYWQYTTPFTPVGNLDRGADT